MKLRMIFAEWKKLVKIFNLLDYIIDNMFLNLD